MLKNKTLLELLNILYLIETKEVDKVSTVLVLNVHWACYIECSFG